MGWVDEVTADRPTAWFRLGEARGTSAADAIGGAAGTYTGTPTLGGAGLVASDSDTAVEFNGSTDYVSVADRAALDLGDSFTVEALVRADAFLDFRGNPCVIADKGSGAYVLRFASVGDGTLLLRRNGVADICTSSVRLARGSVYHVVATKNGSAAAIFVNGADVTVARSRSTMANNGNALGIGAADLPSPNGFFDGALDELAFYAGALSPSRIAAHYAALAGLAGAAAAEVAAVGAVSASAELAAAVAVEVAAFGSLVGAAPEIVSPRVPVRVPGRDPDLIPVRA